LKETGIAYPAFLLLQSVLDTRKQVFEELLWEHQDLNEAFAALKLEHSHCQGSLEPPASFVPAAEFTKL
jgi:hypothetical protein